MSRNLSVHVDDLSKAQLDWLVGNIAYGVRPGGYSPSESWNQAGGLVDSYEIEFTKMANGWRASTGYDEKMVAGYGRNHQIATLRYVVVKFLGEVVEVPAEVELTPFPA